MKNSEDFLLKQGWKKIKGFRVDMEFLEDYDHYDNVYFESTEDFIFPCEYWSDGEEKAYEDPDQAMEREFEILPNKCKYCDCDLVITFTSGNYKYIQLSKNRWIYVCKLCFYRNKKGMKNE
jgi:hypothetical protein